MRKLFAICIVLSLALAPTASADSGADYDFAAGTPNPVEDVTDSNSAYYDFGFGVPIVADQFVSATPPPPPAPSSAGTIIIEID